MRTRIAALLALAALTLMGCGTAPAQTILSKIPGCTGIWTSGGNSLDNTISEGGCTLSDETSLNIYVFEDAGSQHDYVYQNDPCETMQVVNPPAPDGCIVGSNPQPWFVDVGTSGGALIVAESDWAKVAADLHGQVVTKIAASWCLTNCPIPGATG
jgi:hypothetical protein